VVVVAERLFTIPITCYVDRRAHEVTDENTAAGRRTGYYEALCGYRVIAAAMAAPVGRPCPEYTAVLVASRPLRDRPGTDVTAARGGCGGSRASAAPPGVGTCDIHEDALALSRSEAVEEASVGDGAEFVVLDARVDAAPRGDGRVHLETGGLGDPGARRRASR
jgi:hypothetical protein